MVLVDGLQGHSALDPVRFDLDGENKLKRESIYSWEKSQEIRPGKVTLRDHSFELPTTTSRARHCCRKPWRPVPVTHVLRTAAGDALEIYDYPGGYAERFDGIDPGGGDQPGELQKLFRSRGARQRRCECRPRRQRRSRSPPRPTCLPSLRGS